MRVIVIDDDAVVVSSLGIVLGAQEDIEVVGSGTSGEDALRLWDERHPDVGLFDIQMPGMDGLEAAERILGDDPDARIVFLTTFSDDEYIVRALRLGARGYLIKQDVATVAPALRSVMRGQCVLEGEVLARAARLSVDADTSAGMKPPDESALACLSEREREVVRAIADGLTNAEVADELCMSAGTVRNRISSILTKLDLSNRTQIAVFYLRNCV